MPRAPARNCRGSGMTRIVPSYVALAIWRESACNYSTADQYIVDEPRGVSYAQASTQPGGAACRRPASRAPARAPPPRRAGARAATWSARRGSDASCPRPTRRRGGAPPRAPRAAPRRPPPRQQRTCTGKGVSPPSTPSLAPPTALHGLHAPHSAAYSMPATCRQEAVSLKEPPAGDCSQRMRSPQA